MHLCAANLTTDLRRYPAPPSNKYRKTRHSCNHHREPEKNQAPDISVVQAERKGCAAVITFANGRRKHCPRSPRLPNLVCRPVHARACRSMHMHEVLS